MSKQDRRQFIKSLSFGTGSMAFLPIVFTNHFRIYNDQIKFLTQKGKDNMLYPRPSQLFEIEVTPPGLAWYPAPGASEYKVEIWNSEAEKIYEKSAGSDPVHLPDKILDAGKYQWDVQALDSEGNIIAKRGKQPFSIAKNAEKLPWENPAKLVDKVPNLHPRLMYTQERVNEIRRTASGSRKLACNEVIKKAEQAMQLPMVKYPEYHKIEDPTTRRLEYGAYFKYFRNHVDSGLNSITQAYIATGEDKYARAAIKVMMELASWPHTQDDVTSLSARWGDEAGLSYARYVHKFYDWLYPAMTEHERKEIHRMCEARAWQAYRHLKDHHNFLTYPGANHDNRTIAYLAEMAIVLAGESDGAVTWLDYALRAMTTIYPHWAGHDGGWANGMPYGLWYNNYYIPALVGLKDHCEFDVSKVPFYRKIRQFFFYCTTPTAEIAPYGDAAERVGAGKEHGEAFGSLLFFYANFFDDPATAWWIDQIPRFEVPAGDHALLYEPNSTIKKPGSLPQSKHFRGIGWAALHSDLTKPTEDTFLIFKSSPYGSFSHNHADQNSFCILKGGRALCIPSGYYGPSYGMPHHDLWTRSTKANNSVLVNGEGQVRKSAFATGFIPKFEDEKTYTYLVGDATEAYDGKLVKFKRHLLFLRPGIFLIADELENSFESSYQWMLHAFEEMKIDGKQIISKRDGAKMQVFIDTPGGLNITQTNQFDTPFNHGIPEKYHKEVDNQWHLTAETIEKAKSRIIGAVIFVSDEKEKSSFEFLQTDGWIGIKSDKTEGWIQIEKGKAGPAGFGQTVDDGKALICANDKDKRKLVFFS